MVQQQLPASLVSINKAAVDAAKAGNHTEALELYEQLFRQLKARHLSHPQQFVAHSNKAASHLVLGQHYAALQEAKQCLELLTTAAASQGLLSPDRHPHWPKACVRLGQAFLGLGQHSQAAAAFEAGLAADPSNPTLRSGLQASQQAVAADLLSGRATAHIKALPAPAAPELITLAPHNTQGLRHAIAAANSSRGTAGQQRTGRGHAVGWKGAGHAAGLLLAAAEGVQQAMAAAAAAGCDIDQGVVAAGSSSAVAAAGYSSDGGSYQLPKLLLTPEAAAADVGLRDVYEYLSTQCAIRAPKQYLYRTLPDSPRMAAWWAATTAAVQAVRDSGRTPRVLLLGAKADVLAVAALRAGAAHVTCVESSPYLAAACAQVLQDNGFPPSTSSIICTPSPLTLKLGPTEGVQVPNVCNCLVADLVDDGVLSGGLVPAVAHALEELLVREQPVLVPQRLTVMAQAVGVRPSVVAVEVQGLGEGGSSSSSDGSGGDARVLDVTAMDAYRWTPSQALPSPLDAASLLPLSKPKEVWHMPLADVVADRSSVQHMDVELTATGSWCCVAFWAELQLFGDITYSTAGPWQEKAASLDSNHNSQAASTDGASGDSGSCPAADAHPIQPATPLLLTYPQHTSSTWSPGSTNPPAGPSPGPRSTAHVAGSSCSEPPATFQAPPSHQPALCWLPGGLPVQEGDVYPLVASHNTVRCAFTIQEADYSFLFHQEPSFPHTHFAMLADQQRLQAYATALSTAINRAAATKRQQQQQTASPQQPQDTAPTSPTAISSGGCADVPELTVVDLGCGSGALSLLAAAALSPQPAHTQCHGPSKPEAVTDSNTAPDGAAAAALSTAEPPSATAAASVPASQPAPASLQQSLRGSVMGIELTAPLAAVAQRTVAANGAAGVVSIVQADAASCRRGQQVPAGGADVIVLDLFDAGLVGHGVLGLVEVAKSALAAEGAQVLPASATLYCMGVELLTVSSWEGGMQQLWRQGKDEQQQQQQQPQQQQVEKGAALGGQGLQAAAGSAGGQASTAEVNLQALQAYRWSDEPDTVLLHQLPHRVLTRPAKLADFDFCAPAGSPYPKELQAVLEVVAAGQMHGLVVWFDLHLAEGVTTTSAPVGFTTGGRPQPGNSQQQHYWGQALHHMAHIPAVLPGDEVQLAAQRDGPKLSFSLADVRRSPAPSSLSSHGAAAAVLVSPAPRPPWLRPGAGIDDPAVWSVKKCQQLLGQMLMRAPGAKFPPIYKDLALMQVHAGSLGLCAATVGAVTQELTMREALAVASQKQLVVSPFALPEAAGTQPPVVWH